MLVDSELVEVSIVAVVYGQGFASLYTSLGAAVLIDGGPAMRPSSADIQAAIARAPTRDVIVLPNSPDAAAAATQACALAAGYRAVVVQTSDLAHGITTMLAYGDMRNLDANVEQMRQAASVAATASIIVAEADTVTPSGIVRAGRIAGCSGGEIVVVADDVVECVTALADRLDAEEPIEVLTVFAGATAPEAERSAVEQALRDRLVGVDIDVRDGGQHRERYLLAWG